jgi:hypothetical protein
MVYQVYILVLLKFKRAPNLLMGDTFLHGVRHGEVEEIFRIEH